MGYKITLTISLILLFVGMANTSLAKNIVPMTKTTTGVVNNVSSQTSSGTTITFSVMQSSAEKIWIQISNKGKEIFRYIEIEYHRNNTQVTILPDILRAPIIDFFAILAGVFLMFWFIVRVLSR